MSERDTDVLIRQFCEDDRPAVASLYTKVFGEPAMLAFMRRWDWQFHGNPASDSVESIMWVAQLEGDIVGFLASFSTWFKVFEKEAIVRLPCDLMVSSQARGRGVGEKLIHAYIASEGLIVNALGYSPPAGRMYHRLGYQEVDAERLRMRPCRLSPIVRDALLRHPRWRTIDAIAPWIVNGFGGALSYGLRAINHAMMPSGSGSVEIRQCTEADTGFDELWKRVSPAFPIAAVRNRRWVQWRFFEDPSFDNQLFCAFDRRGDLLGYVVVRVSTRRGLRFGRILDLFCDPDASDLAGSLLAAGAVHLEAEGVDLITCLGHMPGLQRVIARYCYFTPKRLQIPAMVIWKGDEEMEGAVYEAEHWHLTHADGDDGFSA